MLGKETVIILKGFLIRHINCKCIYNKVWNINLKLFFNTLMIWNFNQYFTNGQEKNYHFLGKFIKNLINGKFYIINVFYYNNFEF